MSTDLYARAKAIVQQAVAKPAAERAAFLDAACAGDATLRREVDSWHSASDQAGSFLDAPVVKLCKACDTTFPGMTSKFCPHCGQPLHDDPRALVGVKLDNLYQIEELLGQGGMGAVYRARHALLGDRVAIKTLKRELSESPQFLKRFQREGQAARSFHHPNAVTVHDLRMTPSGLLYMVLEYIAGTDARGLLRSRGRLSVEETLEILRPLAAVLDEAHAAGVVHRDLKPENVMIADGGRGGSHVKLLDLGIAKLLEPIGDRPVTELTAVDQVLGTPPYMSPEQWWMPQSDGEPQVDRRADVYSLAVMAYEMLTGAWPYPGRTAEDWRRQHLGSPVPDAHQLYAWVPESIAQVLSRGLAKARAERPATAGQFVADLERAAKDAEVGDEAAATLPESEVRSVSTDAATLRMQAGIVAASDSAATAAVAQLRPDTVVEPPLPRAAPPTLRATEKRPTVAYVAIAVIVAAITVGGAYALVGRTPDGGSNTANANAIAPDAPKDPAPPAKPEPAEAVRYWVEARNANNEVTRATGADPLPTANGFRFHFKPQSPGYFYVLGPNEEEVLTLLYSGGGKPPVAKGEDFVFPQSGWAEPTRGSTVDHVTIVFSPTPLADVRFLAARPPHALTPDELRAFEALRRTSAVDPSNVRPADGETSQRVLSATPDKAMVFDITIVHGQ